MLNLWVGIISIFVSVFAVVILYLTRANILDILDKDVILFDKNFELKKNAIDAALKLIDDIEEKGKEITLKPEVVQNAKEIYNDLLCVVSDVAVADEFYNITLDNNSDINETRLAQFKLMCRKDIGLKTKKAKAVKRILEKQQATMGENETILRTNAMTSNIQNLSANNDAFANISRTTPVNNSNQTQSIKPIQTSVQTVKPAQPVKTINTAPAQVPQPVKPLKTEPAKRGRPKKTN